jgi:hypothetical protein
MNGSKQPDRPAFAEVLAAVVVVVAVLAVSGVPWLSAVRAGLAAIWLVLVPGIALVAGLGIGRGAPWGTAAVLGAAAAGPVYFAAVAACAPAVEPAAVMLAYPVPAAVWLFGTTRRSRPPAPEPVDLSPWAAAFVVVAFLALVHLPAFGTLPGGGAEMALREPLLNANASFFRVALASQFGTDNRLVFPFAADHVMPFFHLHSHALMALCDRLSGAGPLAVEFRVFPLLSMVLGLVGIRAALLRFGVARPAAAWAALAALIGNPVLVLVYGALPQTVLALAFFAVAAGLTAEGFAGRNGPCLWAGGALFGVLAQVDLQWSAVVLPGLAIGLLWPSDASARRATLHVLAAAACSGLCVSLPAACITGIPSWPPPVALQPGAFFTAAVAAIGARASGSAAAAAALVAATLAPGAAALWYARAGWSAVPPVARRVFAGSAALALCTPVFVNVPVIPPMTANFAFAAAAVAGLLAAVGFARRGGVGAFVTAGALVAAAVAIAGTALWRPATQSAAVDAVEWRVLAALRGATRPAEIVAARERTPAEALIWIGATRRRAAGWVVGPELAPLAEPVFGAPGSLARARRVQHLLDSLPRARDSEDAAAILREIAAPVVELPVAAGRSPPLAPLLSPVVVGAKSGYYRVNVARADD